MSQFELHLPKERWVLRGVFIAYRCQEVTILVSCESDVEKAYIVRVFIVYLLECFVFFKRWSRGGIRFRI